MNPTWEIIGGDCLDVLRGMPDNMLHAAVTSPPYYRLRTYPDVRPGIYGGDRECPHAWFARGDLEGQDDTLPNGESCALCGAWRGLLGSEPTIAMWVANLVEILRELRRVLRHYGVCWVQLGDKWNCQKNGRANRDARRRLVDDRSYGADAMGLSAELGPKQLILLPYRVAIAMQEDGWVIRQLVTQRKSNARPDHRKDLPGHSVETIIMATKRQSYFYDAYGEREPVADAPGETKHLRDVWEEPTSKSHGKHVAAFPVWLPKRCIRLSTSEIGCCSKCGAPLVRQLLDVDKRAKRFSNAAEQEAWNVRNGRPARSGSVVPPHSIGKERKKITVGWRVTCKCNADVVPCRVADIFSGSGTTGVAAIEAGRSYIGIEASPRYVASSIRRLRGVTPPLEVRHDVVEHDENEEQPMLIGGDELDG